MCHVCSAAYNEKKLPINNKGCGRDLVWLQSSLLENPQHCILGSPGGAYGLVLLPDVWPHDLDLLLQLRDLAHKDSKRDNRTIRAVHVYYVHLLI